MTINDRLREYRAPVFRNFGQALQTALHLCWLQRYGQRDTNKRISMSEARK
jgi:hypothetical protein